MNRVLVGREATIIGGPAKGISGMQESGSKMKLQEKIEKAHSCVFCRIKNKCILDGYPPFDCETCGTYQPREESEGE